MSSQPSKTSAQLHNISGNVKEKVGGALNIESLHRSGVEEKAAAQSELNQAKAKGYAEGTQDRVVGKKDAVVGAVTGDRSQETQGNWKQEKGDKQQEFNRRY